MATGILENSVDKEEQRIMLDSFKTNLSPWKTILKIYKGNYKYLLLSAFFNVLQNSPVVLLPIVTSNIINCASYPSQHSLTEIIINVAIMFAFIVQNIFTSFLSANYRSIANRRVEWGLRSAIARKLQQLSISFQKEMQSGQIQSKMMRDVDQIIGLTGQLFTVGVSVILNLTVAVSVTLSKNIIVFSFFLVTIPTAVFIMRAFRTKLRKSNEAYRQDIENTSASVIEMLNLMPVTKAHGLENIALNRFNRQLFKVADHAHEVDRNNALFSGVAWITFQIFQLICLTFTGILAYKRIIQIGDITLYQSYFSTIVGQINAIIALLPTITSGLESVRSVGDIMCAYDDEDNRGKTRLTGLNGRYEFRHVSFGYKDADTKVLTDLNLVVEKGQTIALVGQSGAGKSTILNMIIGFYRPQNGQLLIDGHDVKDLDLHEYRQFISTVPQASVLFSGSIKDNITYGMPHYSEQQLKTAIKVANLEEVINNLPNGIDTLVGEHGDKLSGGQKQRIAIARAVIRDARVIIFDEATSALDTVSEKLIQDSIEQLSKDRTTFIVAHRLSTIRNADKIAVIGDGGCIEYGTFDELMAKKGEFYKYKTLQS